jgi:hypothetical protein
VCKFLWPLIIIIASIRAILMVVELERKYVSLARCTLLCSRPRSKDKIQWECNNGGQLWTSTKDQDVSTGNLPAGFCGAGYSTLNTSFIVALLADLVCQIYMCFLNWRFSKRTEHYAALPVPGLYGNKF